MKCFFCDQEARAVCSECGRASCKDHGSTTVNYRHVTAGFTFVCNDCRGAWRNPAITVPAT